MSELYGSLKVDDGIRKIGVNDKGDYIELSVNDTGLTDRFLDMISWFEKKDMEIDEEREKIEEKYGDAKLIGKDEEGNVVYNTDALIEVSRLRTEVYRECCKKIDGVFGEGSCKKIFGDIVPDEVLILDFFDQIAPILEKMAAERGEKINMRYDRNKKRQKKQQKQRSKEQLIEDYKAGK